MRRLFASLVLLSATLMVAAFEWPAGTVLAQQVQIPPAAQAGTIFQPSTQCMT